jgi:hypothetical protein
MDDGVFPELEIWRLISLSIAQRLFFFLLLLHTIEERKSVEFYIADSMNYAESIPHYYRRRLLSRL